MQEEASRSPAQVDDAAQVQVRARNACGRRRLSIFGPHAIDMRHLRKKWVTFYRKCL